MHAHGLLCVLRYADCSTAIAPVLRRWARERGSDEHVLSREELSQVVAPLSKLRRVCVHPRVRVRMFAAFAMLAVAVVPWHDTCADGVCNTCMCYGARQRTVCVGCVTCKEKTSSVRQSLCNKF